MKTTKKISVLSLVLIFSAVAFASSAAILQNAANITVNPMITHEVTVSLSADLPLCNEYLVEIVDGNGNRVSPAKAYRPGVVKYAFYERGPASGVRIARLVLKSSHGQICQFELFATPVIKTGQFKAGEIYRYDLFPQLQSTIKD